MIFADNIAVADAQAWQAALTVTNSKNVSLTGNVLSGARCTEDVAAITETATLIDDPGFIHAGTDPRTADFHLEPSSPVSQEGAFPAHW